MKTKPILFSTPMVQAILDGRKTQTRRIIKSKHESGLFQVCSRKSDGQITGLTSLDWDERPKNDCTNDIQPLAKVGDILWVRETWKVGAWNDEDAKAAFDYKASPELKKTPWVEFEDIDRFNELHLKLLSELDSLGLEPTIDEENERFYYNWLPGESPFKWKPSIYMPKEACRIFLEVNDVRVERLKDISSVDAKAEGIEFSKLRTFPDYRNYLIPESDKFHIKFPFLNPIKSFQSLWQSINGKESWDQNPWVWVYDFKRVERPENFIQ